MVSSMTGYGKGEVITGVGTVTVEIRGVNHRFVDFSIRLPRSLNGYEREVERIIRRRIKRGHIYVAVSLDKSIEVESYGINRDFLRRAYRALSDFTSREGIPGTVDINTLLSLPDAFMGGSEAVLPGELWPHVRKALGLALGNCIDMRRAEGMELFNDINRRLASIEKTVTGIEKRAPGAIDRSLARARRRLEQMLGGTDIDENRWVLEAAIMVDRTDFSEELVRIKSHLRQFGVVLKRGGEVSKKLTFLLQEIHREATTMGNKAVDSTIIRHCLAIKEGVEKIREQVQNLE